ncbi:hypothetical protein X566_01755 [Afipia sp. P52-10]|nr:hypothetical protein X566_01755 [Afipia sp. P52-10]
MKIPRNISRFYSKRRLCKMHNIGLRSDAHSMIKQT